MPELVDVLTAFRAELIAAGIVRRPSDAGAAQGQPYPMVIEPLEGPPAPGELGDGDHDHDELVISLLGAGGFAPASGFEASSAAKRAFDIRYRTGHQAANANLRVAMHVDALIRARLVRPETNYGYGWLMGLAPGQVWVHEATPIGEFAPLGRSRGTGFDHVAKWVIETAP